jgi:sugar/nucleoside kinase (ribokinase family)
VIGTLGDLVEDVAVRLDGPIHIASDTPAIIDRRRGGSAANTAMCVVRLGSPARFIGQVGTDAIGTALLATMSAAGVLLAVRRSGRTGTIVVLVDQHGERTMLSDRGTCGDLADPDPAWLDGLAVLHVPAYSLVDGALAESAAAMIGWAHARAITVSIDSSSASLIEGYGASAMRDLLASLRPDVLLCNELEAQVLGGPETVAPLASQVTIVKQGAGPALVLPRSGPPGAVEAHRLAGVADTTGAGDAFAAGFLVARAAGATDDVCVRAGHDAARDAIVEVSRRVPSTGIGS